MRHNIYKTLAVLTLAVLSFTAFAQQNLRSAYFIEGYTYRYKFNPSFKTPRGHFALPVLGNLNLGVESNLGLSTLIYPTADGKLTTFMDPDAISMEDFEKKISDINPLNVNVNTSIFSIGFWAKKSYHTLDISVRTDVGVGIPGDLFRFFKGAMGSEGVQNAYDIKKLAVNTNAYAELGYGYARDITSWIHIGGRLKFLYGLAHGSATFSKFNVKAAADEWAIDAQGHLDLSSLIPISTNADKELQFGEVNVDALGKVNLGFAADLGLSIDFLKYFTASAAIVDVGFINWSNLQSTQTLGKPWKFTGFKEDIDYTGDGQDFDAQMDAAVEGLKELVKFEDVVTGSKTKMIPMTLNVGLEGRMPFFKSLSVGVLSSTKFNGPLTWAEGRAYVNLNPAKWFGISANYGISTFGSTFGAAMSIHAPGFNLFIGTDSILTLTDVNPQYVPINTLNTNVAVGLNIMFGKYHGREFAKKAKKAAKTE